MITIFKFAVSGFVQGLGAFAITIASLAILGQYEFPTVSIFVFSKSVLFSQCVRSVMTWRFAFWCHLGGSSAGLSCVALIAVFPWNFVDVFSL